MTKISLHRICHFSIKIMSYVDFNLDDLITEIDAVYGGASPLNNNDVSLEPERDVNFYYSNAINPYCTPKINEMFMMSLQRTVAGRAQNAKKIDDESIHIDLIQHEIRENERKIRAEWRSLNTENTESSASVKSRKTPRGRTKIRSSSIRLQIGNLQMLNASPPPEPASRGFHSNLRSNSIRIPEKALDSSPSYVSPLLNPSSSNDSLLLINNSSETEPETPSPKPKKDKVQIEMPTGPAAFGIAPQRKFSKSNLKADLAAARQLSPHLRKSRASISNEMKTSEVVIPDDDLRRAAAPTGRRRPTRPNS